MREFCGWDPMQPIFQWLEWGFAFRFGVGGKANFSVFRYQHVGIPNAKLWRWGSKPKRGPNANGFASQWNIGFNRHVTKCLVLRVPTDLIKYFTKTFPWAFLNFPWPSLLSILHSRGFQQNGGKYRLSTLMLNFLVLAKDLHIWYNPGAKLVKFRDRSQNSMTFGQSFLCSMTFPWLDNFNFPGFPVSVATLESDTPHQEPQRWG